MLSSQTEDCPGSYTWHDGTFYLKPKGHRVWTSLDKCPMYALMAQTMEIEKAAEVAKAGIKPEPFSEGWFLSQHLRSLGWQVKPYA